MLTFQMGARLSVPDLRGNLLQEGELKISIRNVYWEAFVGENAFVSSDDITPELFMAKFMPAAFNSAFVRLAEGADPNLIKFEFSGFFSLKVDTKSCMDDLGDKFEILLPDGRYIISASDGVLELFSEYEQIRATHSRRSKP